MQPRLNLQALSSHLCEQSKCPLPFPTGTTSTDQRAVQHRVRLEQELALGSLRSDCSDLVFLLGLPWHASSRQCRASGACCYKSPKLAPNIHVHRRHALPKRTKSRQEVLVASASCRCMVSTVSYSHDLIVPISTLPQRLMPCSVHSTSPVEHGQGILPGIGGTGRDCGSVTYPIRWCLPISELCTLHQDGRVARTAAHSELAYGRLAFMSCSRFSKATMCCQRLPCSAAQALSNGLL